MQCVSLARLAQFMGRLIDQLDVPTWHVPRNSQRNEPGNSEEYNILNLKIPPPGTLAFIADSDY